MLRARLRRGRGRDRILESQLDLTFLRTPMTTTTPHRPVLIVEDHEDTREMVEMYLEHVGFTVRTAGDGAEALEEIAHTRPCLILLDVTMPVMDGVTFARELRRSSDPELARTPIVLLTAVPDTREAVEKTAALDVIRKPISFERVLEAVRRYCTFSD
jgi:CheY-like chemotaxis protein